MKEIDNKNNLSQEEIYSQPITFLKSNYKPVVPLVIYQYWSSNELPTFMNECVESLKKDNPEFEHHLYNDDSCKEFIKTHFSQEIVNAFDSLIPASYRSDLFRFCILYIYGGFYLDIKLHCVNGFKLIELSENEHFPLDRENHFQTPTPISCGLLVCKKNNPLLLLAINRILQNIKNNYYGYSALYPTGPGLLSEVITENNLKSKLNIDIFYHIPGGYYIYKDRFIISLAYKEYGVEKNNYFISTKTKHYDNYWNEKNIYKTNNI